MCCVSWLTASGLFSAVLAPGSRLRADLAMEGELLSLLALPSQAVSRASLGLVMLDLRPAAAVRALFQADETASAPLERTDPPAIARAGRNAVASLMARVEARIAVLAA